MTFTAASIFSDKTLMLPRHVSCLAPSAASGQTRTVAHLASHTSPLSVLSKDDGNSPKKFLESKGYRTWDVIYWLPLVSTEF